MTPDDDSVDCHARAGRAEVRVGWAGAGRCHGELAAGRREVRLDLARLAGLAPAELSAEDRGHPRGDRRAPIRQLLGEPRPARQDVVEREGQLVAGRPGDLGLEERCGPATSGRSRPRLRSEGDDRRRLRAVPGDQPDARRPARRAASAGIVDELGRDPGQGAGASAAPTSAPAPPSGSGGAFASVGPSTASMTSRAITR